MKAAQQAHPMMFKGIKGLVASGPGKTKSPVIANLHRPEGKVSIVKTAGAKKTGAMPTKVNGAPSKAVQHGAKVTAKGHSGIGVTVRPEPTVRRDSASVIKPHTN